MPRKLLVEGEKEFRITIPDDAKVTFGPWSPPKGRYTSEGGRGTLRIYKGTKDNIIGCFSGVTSFREEGLDYSERVAVEEGAKIWKSDQNGYEREDKIKVRHEWQNPQLTAGKGKKKK